MQGQIDRTTSFTPTGVADRVGQLHAERVLDAIIALGPATAPDLNLSDYLARLAEAVCTALDYRRCLVYLHDYFDDAFYAEATHGLSATEREEVLNLPVPTRIAAHLMERCYQMGHGYYLPTDAAVWEHPAVQVGLSQPPCATAVPCGRWPWGDLLLIPLPTGGTIPIGYLLMSGPDDGQQPTAHTLRALAALASNCANVVESARLYGLRHEEALISSVLLQVSKAAGTPDQELLFRRTSTALADLLGADHCMVWHSDGDSDPLCLHPVAAAERPAQALQPSQIEQGGRDLRLALHRGEPIVVEAVEPAAPLATSAAERLAQRLGLASALLIPLFLHDTFVGAITVGWTGLPHRFRVRDLDIARGVSRLVGVALQNARLYRDVTQQAERNAQLYEREREAVQRLQELDQLRSDFVTTVSHELRTPLTGIKGFTETLLSYWERMDDARRQEMVRRINASSNRLERLVQDLLFISRVESGTLPLRAVPLLLHPLLAAAIGEIEGKYPGQEIQVCCPAPPLVVVADPDRLQQVLVNLLDNAAKYSREGRPIRVRCRLYERVARLSVIDRGPGIARTEFQRLFTRFGKLDHAARAGHGGTGLGLYICKSLIEAMGGEIALYSRPDWGSVFTVTLPLATTPTLVTSAALFA